MLKPLFCALTVLLLLINAQIIANPIQPDPDMEKNQETSGQKVLDEFIAKGGHFYAISPWDLENSTCKTIAFNPNDSVYPICTGGFCRSQTLWALMQSVKDRIVLFPPHATRYGFDPYNGEMNWHRNKMELGPWPDEFEMAFGLPKTARFGFPEFMKYKDLKAAEVTPDILTEIKDFYSTHYFGPDSQWNGQKGQRRLYIAFAVNAHVIMYRLNQCNDDLSQVYVYFIDSPDYITKPMIEWNLIPRCKETHERMAEVLRPILDFSQL